jgi:hypothetical protein
MTSISETRGTVIPFPTKDADFPASVVVAVIQAEADRRQEVWQRNEEIERQENLLLDRIHLYRQAKWRLARGDYLVSAIAKAATRIVELKALT